MIRKWILLATVIMGLTGCYISSLDVAIKPEEQDKVEFSDSSISPLHKDPLGYDVSQLGLGDNEGITTVDEALEKYPNYAWGANTYVATHSRHCRLPNSSFKSCYVNGLENAKRVAYEGALRKHDIKEIKDKYFGEKVLVVGIDNWEEAEYECEPLKQEALIGYPNTVAPREEVYAGRGYWHCSSRVTIRFLNGRQLRYKKK